MASVYDSDYEPEEVDLAPNIQPYQHEPIRQQIAQLGIDSDSDSDRDQHDNDANVNGGQLPTDLDWCMCGCCTILETAEDCKCCHSYPTLDEKRETFNLDCITAHEGFIANCLNMDVLEISYYEFRQRNGPLLEGQLIHEAYRYVAYRRCARWIWRILRKHDRRILPACAVSAIRDRFPSQQYCGFRYPNI